MFLNDIKSDCNRQDTKMVQSFPLFSETPFPFLYTRTFEYDNIELPWLSHVIGQKEIILGRSDLMKCVFYEFSLAGQWWRIRRNMCLIWATKKHLPFQNHWWRAPKKAALGSREWSFPDSKKMETMDIWLQENGFCQQSEGAWKPLFL